MAREDVNIKVSADVAEAIRMWRAMEQGPQGMANELDALGKKGKNAATGMEAEFGKLVGKWASIGGAIQGARMILDGMIKAQEQYNRMVKEASVPLDTLTRNFVNQAGYTNQQGAVAQRRILGIAEQRAVTPQTAFEAATQLASSGFAPDVASGEGLNELLKMANSINAAGGNVNVAEIGGAVVNFLQATRMPGTAESIAKVGPQVQGLFQQTDLKAEHLASFAPKAATIAQMTGLKQEQLPVLSQFLELTNIDQAGTAFKTAMVSLATAGADNTKTQALKNIGLKPEDVDFVGEDFFAVQSRMAKAFESASPDVANIAAKQILGQEGLLARAAIFTSDTTATTQQRLKMFASGEQYERAAAITEGGIEARGRAADSRNVAAFGDPNFLDFDTVRKDMMTAMQAGGSSRFSQAIAGGVFDMYSMLPGATADTALRAALGPANATAANQIIDQNRATMPGDIKVRVELTDQDGVAIPHKSDVDKLNRAK